MDTAINVLDPSGHVNTAPELEQAQGAVLASSSSHSHRGFVSTVRKALFDNVKYVPRRSLI